MEPGQRRQPLHLHAAVGREVVVGEDGVGRDAEHAVRTQEEGEVAGERVGLVLVGRDRQDQPDATRALAEQVADEKAARRADHAGDVDGAPCGECPAHLGAGGTAWARELGGRICGRGGHSRSDALPGITGVTRMHRGFPVVSARGATPPFLDAVGAAE